MDRDLHNINSDNRQFGLTNVTNTYLRKNIDAYDRLSNFEKPIKNLAPIDDKI